MLTVKFTKYYRTDQGRLTDQIERELIRETRGTQVTYEPGNIRILQLGDATAGETTAYKVGDRSDCEFDVAYVMNEEGRTICRL